MEPSSARYSKTITFSVLCNFLAITTSSLAPFTPLAIALVATPGIRISALYLPARHPDLPPFL